MSQISKFMRFAYSLLVLFGSGCHIGDVFREYLSYPILVDILLENPRNEQIPYVSMCVDLRKYLHPKKLVEFRPILQQIAHYHDFKSDRFEFKCFLNSYEFKEI